MCKSIKKDAYINSIARYYFGIILRSLVGGSPVFQLKVFYALKLAEVVGDDNKAF